MLDLRVPGTFLEAEARPKSWDVSDACAAVERKLDQWSTWILPMGANSYQYLGKAWKPGAVCEYLFRQAEEFRRQDEEARRDPGWSNYMVDERPYFKDPQPIAFDPEEAFARDDFKNEDGVTLQEVWKDPLARQIWLAIKARHLTCQYFRGACLQQAEWIRKKPPKTHETLSLSTGMDTFRGVDYHFKVQFHPYIVRTLIDEGRWPYFTPGVGMVAERQLGYVTPLLEVK